ncbi:MAG TPA: hypothetical protein VN622_03775 [Clostridia bacterium]|nr:hypothetical protein [Clostridia bacterium]
MKWWIALTILALMFGAGCSHKLPLRIVQSGDKVTVDVQTLGEYQTTVKRIRLVNKTSRAVVWELKTQSGTPQINQIELKVGENPVALTGVASGAYAVVTPTGIAAFSLSLDVDYEIQLWGEDLESSKATGTFRLADRPS